MKKISLILIPVILLLALITFAGRFAPATAEPVATTITTNSNTTPQLIEAAYSAGTIDRATADSYLYAALFDYAQLPAVYRGQAAWQGTDIGRGLTQAELSIPQTGDCGGQVGGSNTYTSTHFIIDYDLPITTTLIITDYVNTLETAWNKEIDTFGWAAPPLHPYTETITPTHYYVTINPLDPTLTGMISTAGTNAGFMGDNPNTAWGDGDAYATCMLLNNSYNGFADPAIDVLQAAVAHHLNRAIQFGYGSVGGFNEPDPIFEEGVATWMEEQVFPTADQAHRQLWPTGTICMGEYTNTPDKYWAVFQGMTEIYDHDGVNGINSEDVLQKFWEITSNEALNLGNLQALDTALTTVTAGSIRPTNLAQAFHTYAIAAKFSKTCGNGYVYPYCFAEGSSYTSAVPLPAVQATIPNSNSSYSGSLANNYTLNWIALPTNTNAYSLRLIATTASGVFRGTVACDQGNKLTLIPFSHTVTNGDIVTIPSFNSLGLGCNSAVAIITNEEVTNSNPISCDTNGYQLILAPAPNYAHLPFVAKPFPTPSPTPAPTAIPTTFANPGFESGHTAWSEQSEFGWALITNASSLPVATHSGSWAAWLGGANNEVSVLTQRVTITAAKPYVHYWHWIASTDLCGRDVAYVKAGSIIVAQYDLCTTSNTNAWVKKVVNFTPYIGQTINFSVSVVTNASNNSNLFVDDFSFSNSTTGDTPPTLATPFPLGSDDPSLQPKR